MSYDKDGSDEGTKKGRPKWINNHPIEKSKPG